jgi:hypothetical protein
MLEEHTHIAVMTTDPSLCTPDWEVFVVVVEDDASEARVDRYLDDISDDELSANAPEDETIDAKNARFIHNQK